MRSCQWSRMVALIVVFIMVIPGLVWAGPGNPDPVDIGQVNSLTFPEDGGKTQIAIDVPSEGTVVDAKLELDGREKTYPAVDNDYSFKSTGEDHAAWKGAITNTPPTEDPDDLMIMKASQADEGNIATSDNTYWNMRIFGPWLEDTGGQPIPAYPIQHFRFNISTSKNIIESISATWEGHGVTNKAGGSVCGAELFIWDQSNLKWVSLDSYFEVCNLAVDRTLSGSFIISGTEGDNWAKPIVDLLVVGVWDMSATQTTISTDDVDIAVWSHTRSFPHDVAVDVVNDRVIEHTYEGELRGIKTFGPHEGFVDALQEGIDNARYEGGDITETITVPISFNSTTGGLMLVTVKVIEVDTPPKLLSDLPDLKLDEDGELANAIDLWEYFKDDHGAINLTYQVNWTEKPDKVKITLQEGHLVHVSTIAPDWSGTAKVRFSASDRFEQTALTKNITITVEPVNDDPVLDALGPFTTYEKEPFTFDVNVTDADMDDTHTFTDDSDLFDIDPETGIIEFTPRTEDIGKYNVNITVTDSNESVDFKVVDLEIKNVNDQPVVTLYLPTDGFITTVDEIKLVWIGEDPDDEELKYDVLLDSGNGYDQVATGLKDAEHVVTGLKNGTTYKWTVVASDGMLKSERPAAFAFKAEIDDGGGGGTVPKPQPNQPPTVKLLSPEKGAEIRTLSPTFSWEGYDAEGDPLEYEVFLYDNEGTLLLQKKTTVAFFKVATKLDNEERYFWTVIPSDGEDTGICKDGQWYFNTLKKGGTIETFDPVINVTVSPEGEVDIGTTISFDATGTHDPDGTITLYIWTLGDGTTLTGPTYEMVDHSFEKGGAFNVSLVVFDNDGNTGIWAHTIDVKEETVDPPGPPEPNDGWLTADQLLIALLVTAMAVAFGTAAAFMAHRKLKYGRYKIEEVFLVYKDGRLVGHEGTAESSEQMIGEKEASDKEVMGGMLAAVQAFVKDSLKDDKVTSSLKVLEYGDHKISIEKGEFTFLAVFVTGNITKDLREKMKDTILDIESTNQEMLSDWDGSMDGMENIKPALAKFMD